MKGCLDERRHRHPRTNSGMTFSCGIALLRGINVGRAKRIAMADLRTLFEELGFTAVCTVLNSGNVVFGSPG